MSVPRPMYPAFIPNKERKSKMSHAEKAEEPKKETTNPVTAIKKIVVVYSNGNQLSFEDEAGVKLSSVKVISNVLKEEIRAAS
jgi:hypothetical protein